MNVFMIGGTGLLGSAAAQLFIDRGHSVRTVALPPLPQGAPIPEEMEIVFRNYLDMTDEEVLELMQGCDCFVFAAGVDERVEFPAPVYDAYKKPILGKGKEVNVFFFLADGGGDALRFDFGIKYFNALHANLRLPFKPHHLYGHGLLTVLDFLCAWRDLGLGYFDLRIDTLF